MYEFLKLLFPINRSITGEGVRETLRLIKEHIPIEIKSVPSGTKVLDWEVPKEWNLTEAYIENKNGDRIIDFKNNNLHVVGYSIPVNEVIDYDDLVKHLYYLEDQPDAIPYVTSYYSEKWGFCLSYNDFKKLKKEDYKVVIKSELKKGVLNYGELIIKGKSKKEVFFSTYVCHPSMANNELSGPVVQTWLAKWILTFQPKYTYRFIFIPETIGSITYLSKNLKTLKQNVIAGFNISCVGDNLTYSYVESRYKNTYADRVIQQVLNDLEVSYKTYSFLERGSDERQYNGPNVDLPIICFCRSKYHEYPEYHTSLDNLDFVSEDGLQGSLKVLKNCVRLIEENFFYKINTFGEPQLGKRGLYPNISTKDSTNKVKDMMNIIAYSDGENDVIDIAKCSKTTTDEVIRICKLLMGKKIMDRKEVFKK